MKLKASFVMTVILALSLQVKAADTPTSLEGCKVVTAEEVQKLMASGAKLFDVRKAAEYAEEHIKGATSLPYDEKSKKEVGYDVSLDKFDDAKLPASKMIFQCNGAECWKSFKSCKWAVSKGKKETYWFRGGIPEWKDKKLPTEK